MTNYRELLIQCSSPTVATGYKRYDELWGYAYPSEYLDIPYFDKLNHLRKMNRKKIKKIAPTLYRGHIRPKTLFGD